MNAKVSLGDRMKRYEGVSDVILTPKMPLIVRVDGISFHTWTKRNKCVKPFDGNMGECMTAAAQAIVNNMQNAKMAYIQSDEISVLFTDYEKLQTQMTRGGRLFKIVADASTLATLGFNRHRSTTHPNNDDIDVGRVARFDGRAYVVPRHDVHNYFVWRQQDATRNSIQSLARAHFSHNQCNNKNTSELQDMLMLEKEISWNDLESMWKRGWCVRRQKVEVESKNLKTGETATILRSRWFSDFEMPVLTKDPSYIAQYVNPAAE